MASVRTVTGPVDAAALGPVSVHEHLLIDLGCWFDPPADAAGERIAALRVAPETEAAVRANPFAVRDNLVLDDLDLAAAELARFRDAGGGTIVDLTLPEIGRDPARLRTLAERTGVRIVMGTGHYIGRAHPPGLAERGAAAIEDAILHDLRVGVEGVRAGVIGEIGTSDPVEPGEALVLAAACAAQRATGVALFVHLDPWGRNGHDVLDRVIAAGVDPARVALCHLDPSLGDLGYARSLAARGAWVCIDIWGDEDAYGGRGMPTDAARAAAVRTAWDEGWADRLLLAQDVCTKTQLHAHGGRGYDHLLVGVPALLAAAGLPATAIERLLVGNPARLLGGGSSAPGSSATLGVMELGDGRRFRGRGALVTGGSSGIGLGAARRLAAEGASVLLVGRTPAKVAAAEAEVRGVAEAAWAGRGDPVPQVRGLVADVTDPAAMEAAADAAHALAGRLDVLVGAAGIDGEGRDALELDPAVFARVMDVNVRGLLVASQAAARRMTGGGAIVLVASVNAFQTEARFADYNASKGAAVLLARTLALDWAERGIRVNAICPGYVRTPMTEAYLDDPATLAGILAHVPLGRVATPDEIAATIVFLASPEAAYITGSSVIIDGGRSA